MNSTQQVPTTHSRFRRSSLPLLFCCFLLPLYVFGWLTEAVWNRNGLNCDVPTLVFIHQRATPVRNAVMVWVTRTGDPRTVLLLGAFALVVLLRKQKRRDAAFLVCAVGGALMLDFVIKNAIHRVRPHLWESPAPEFDFSFPSGHSTGTMALMVALVALAWRTRWCYTALFFGAFYVLNVGFSRLYLGVHYPSDVLGGWILSYAWVSGLILARGILFASVNLVHAKKCVLLADSSSNETKSDTSPPPLQNRSGAQGH
jgi:membrane-associated phospholipid phosphatase